jgi:hypothetical protein
MKVHGGDGMFAGVPEPAICVAGPCNGYTVFPTIPTIPTIRPRLHTTPDNSGRDSTPVTTSVTVRWA